MINFFCLDCGQVLSKEQSKIIYDLQESSAHVFPKGYCKKCWEIKFPKKEKKHNK